FARIRGCWVGRKELNNPPTAVGGNLQHLASACLGGRWSGQNGSNEQETCNDLKRGKHHFRRVFLECQLSDHKAVTSHRTPKLALLRALLLLFVGEALAITFQPGFQVLRRLFQFIAVQQPAPKRFKKRSRTNVVSQLLVSLLLSTFCYGNKKLFIKCCQPALHAP